VGTSFRLQTSEGLEYVRLLRKETAEILAAVADVMNEIKRLVDDASKNVAMPVEPEVLRRAQQVESSMRKGVLEPIERFSKTLSSLGHDMGGGRRVNTLDAWRQVQEQIAKLEPMVEHEVPSDIKRFVADAQVSLQARHSARGSGGASIFGGSCVTSFIAIATSRLLVGEKRERSISTAFTASETTGSAGTAITANRIASTATIPSSQ
jgi:hypothetical protein